MSRYVGRPEFRRPRLRFGVDPRVHAPHQTGQRLFRDVGQRGQRHQVDAGGQVRLGIFCPQPYHSVIVPIRLPAVRHADLESAGQAGGVRLLSEQDEDGEHRQPVAVKEGRLAKPDGLDQVRLMARLELDVHQVGLRSADADHLVGGSRQGGDVRVDHLDWPGRADAKAFQPGGRIIPDQFFRRDVEAVELHEFHPRSDHSDPCDRCDPWYPSASGRWHADIPTTVRPAGFPRTTMHQPQGRPGRPAPDPAPSSGRCGRDVDFSCGKPACEIPRLKVGASSASSDRPIPDGWWAIVEPVMLVQRGGSPCAGPGSLPPGRTETLADLCRSRSRYWTVTGWWPSVAGGQFRR